MNTQAADRPDDDPIGEAQEHDERPTVVGDFGQDSAFATESHPEGLRYGKKPRAPGEEPHGDTEAPPHEDPGAISIG